MSHIHFQRKLDLCKLLAKFSKHFDMHLQPKIDYTSKWIEKESFDKNFQLYKLRLTQMASMHLSWKQPKFAQSCILLGVFKKWGT